MWPWWSGDVLAAPEAARTLQDDLSVTVLEQDEKEKGDKVEGRDAEERATRGAMKTQLWGLGSAATWGCGQGWLPDTAVPSRGLEVCVQNT